MADNKKVCNQCKFYHTYTVESNEGTCRRRAPVVTGGQTYIDMAMWPKLYGNIGWCGEFTHKDTKEQVA